MEKISPLHSIDKVFINKYKAPTFKDSIDPCIGIEIDLVDFEIFQRLYPLLHFLEFKSVFLSKSSAELWSPKTLRGSQGAQLNLRCYEGQDLLRLFDQVSLPIYSLSVCGDSLYGDDIPKDLILILGSEGGGINAEIISKSTKSISIPMHGSIESLNVGAAAGIFIYEYFRRHRLNVGD